MGRLVREHGQTVGGHAVPSRPTATARCVVGLVCFLRGRVILGVIGRFVPAAARGRGRRCLGRLTPLAVPMIPRALISDGRGAFRPEPSLPQHSPEIDDDLGVDILTVRRG